MRITRLCFLVLLVSVAAGPSFGATHITPTLIGESIRDRLYHARIFDHGQVQVSFENGVATLSGSVDSLGVKMDAERAARKSDDVTEVVNNINIRTEDVTDREIGERARKEIVTYYAYGIFDHIVLASQGNRLVVSGEVSQPFKKEDIGKFLAHIQGVAGLENNLEVLPTSIYDDSLRLAIARAIFNDPYFVHYATQAVPPIHIIVKNGNVTLEGVVGSGLDRAKAENDARFAATFFALRNNLRVEGK